MTLKQRVETQDDSMEDEIVQVIAGYCLSASFFLQVRSMNSFLQEVPETNMPDFQCYGFCHKRLCEESKKEFTVHLKLFDHWLFPHVSWHIPLSCCLSIRES